MRKLGDPPMPIVKNWVEELVWEWLLLRGYLALPNIRLKSGKRGSVKEADILGFRLLKQPKEQGIIEKLEIVHVETGSLAENFEEKLKTIRGKFARERVETIKKMVVDTIELESVVGKSTVGFSRVGASEIEYKPIYIAYEVAKGQVDKLKEELKKDGIEFLTLEEAIEKILHDIDDWKKAQVEKGYRRTTEIRLPEGYWLLKLIDFMKSKGFIKTKKETQSAQWKTA